MPAGRHLTISMRSVGWSMLLILLVSGCAPVPAKLEPPRLRNDVPLAGLQASSQAAWPARDWWRSYGDPQLDRLIRIALAHSPDLAQAQSRVKRAEQSVRLAAAQAGLRIDGKAQLNRQRLSEYGMIPPQSLGFTWYNQADLGIQFQYDFDWWGQQHATMAAALDQAHAAAAQGSEAALILQNAVANSYFGWLADRARGTLAARTVAIQQHLLHIATLRVAQGIALADTAQQAKLHLAAAQQAQTVIDTSARIRKIDLAALLGIAPAELPPLQARALPRLSSGVPADARLNLIARRPDIAASRWQVKAALRQTDVARTQFLPNIRISALAGLSSTNLGLPAPDGSRPRGSLSHLFSSAARVFSLTPAVYLPIFEGGLLQANYGISRAYLDAAIAQYNSTVITAAREVATQVLRAEQLAAQRRQQASQVGAGQHLLATALARARQGIRDAQESLAAQAQLLQQQDTALRLQAQALSTDLALIKALGGGYRDASSPSPASSPADAHGDTQ